MSSTSTKTPSLFGRFWALSWKIKLISLLIVPVVLFYAGTLLLSLFNYSVGERTGVLSKISRKGVACWTTEGELAQPSFSKSSALRSGGAPIDNTFYFSVPNPNVRDRWRPSPGQPCPCNMSRSCSRSTCRCRCSASAGRSFKSPG